MAKKLIKLRNLVVEIFLPFSNQIKRSAKPEVIRWHDNMW